MVGNLGRFTDGQWYRVKIDSRTASGEYRVKFIDFGNVCLASSFVG